MPPVTADELDKAMNDIKSKMATKTNFADDEVMAAELERTFKYESLTLRACS